MNTTFIERFIEESKQGKSRIFNKNIGIVFVALFLGVVLLNTTGCTQLGSQTQQTSEEVAVDTTQSQEPMTEIGEEQLADVQDVDIADKKSDIEENTVEINDEELNESMVSLYFENTGRPDPFLPDGEAAALRAKSKGDLPFDLVEPTTSLGEGEAVEKILTAEVSGIMYDNYSPSAILKIGDTEYLVRSGDEITGEDKEFTGKVIAISKKAVTVQSGVNTYKAGVGQLLKKQTFDQGNVVNLQDRFGSSKNRTSTEPKLEVIDELL